MTHERSRDPESRPVSRYTDNALFGGNLSARATAVYLLGENSSLKLMGGQSYRVPSLFERTSARS